MKMMPCKRNLLNKTLILSVIRNMGHNETATINCLAVNVYIVMTGTYHAVTLITG